MTLREKKTMKKFLIIILGLAVIGSGIAFALQNMNKPRPMKPEKALVVYFSATGNTERVARNLAKAIGADIYQIKPVKPYTSADLNWKNEKSRSSIEMKSKDARPKIVSDNFSPEKYNAIFLGFPIWWGTAPKIVHTFLEKYDFSNKKIIIFATSGSSGLGDSANILRPSVSSSAQIINGKVLDPNLTVNELRNWAASLR